MSDMTIMVEHLQRGQPENYAPHVYEARITVRGGRLLEGQMRDLVRATVYSFSDAPRPDPMDDHFRPKLKRLELLSSEQLTEHAWGPREEVWIARVENPYTD